MRRTAALAAFAVLAGCAPLPDTVGEAAPSRTVWALDEMNGAAAGFPATIRLLSDGEVRGEGPCNSYSARQTAPLPWVEFEDLRATERGCAQLAEEQVYFQTLQAMEFAEVAGDSLLLTNTAGQSLYFRAAARRAGS